MGRGFIVLGDATSHGGTVIEASANSSSGDVRIARVGDKVTCPKKGHGTCAIVTGDASIIIDGQMVARDGDKTACGAVLIASQGKTTVG